MAGINSSQLSAQTQVTNLVVGTPAIANVAMADADTEYDYALPNGTKRVIMQNRNDGLVKVCYVQYESDTNYWTIFPGQQKDIEFMDGTTGVTIYFQSPLGGQLLEIESWK